MNAVSVMLVAYACISPVEAFALCINASDHKPDRLPITNIYKCPPTDIEAIEAAIRSIASLGEALEKNAAKWDELNQTLERLNKHISAAPAPFRVESPAAAVKPTRVVKQKSSRKVKLADRCGSMTAVWYTKPNGHRKYRCR